MTDRRPHLSRRGAGAVPLAARQGAPPAARQAHRPAEATRVSAAPPAPRELELSRSAAGTGETQPARRRRHRGSTKAGFAALNVLAAAAIVPALTGCGAPGPATLNYYSFPDPSGATAKTVAVCNAHSHGKYTIFYHQLAYAADAQRQQLARRLAAHDSTVDIMGLDVTWADEFAQAGWILPWTGTNRQRAESDTLQPALDTATWHGQLYAVPGNTNAQLLWYRSDLVPHAPATWAQMIADAEALARQGKPHYIEIQGAPYEGTVIWFNTLLASAGGSVLTSDSRHVSLGPPAVQALSIMRQLATSPAADPSLPVQMENANRLAMESGRAAFELNYPFVYPAMHADNPALFRHFKWAPYPQVAPGQSARVTIGGIDLAVGAYAPHPQLAFQAVLCLRDKANQVTAAIVGGLPPTIVSLYDDPKMFPDYPFHADLLNALQTASVRPRTPAYQSLATDIERLLSPPAAINPAATEHQMASQITKTLQSSS